MFAAPQTTTSSLFSNPAPTTSLFGNTTTQQPAQQQGTSLFGQPQQASSLFGAKPAATTTLFGATQNQGNLFGASNNTQNQQAQQQQQAQPLGGSLGQSVGNRVWSEQEVQPRQKSISDQIQVLAGKWDPSNPSTVFKAYLYNKVDQSSRPFFGPGPSDNEEKWEEALRKAPNDSSIPILVAGFELLGRRMTTQQQTLNTLQGRLHEINNGLTELLRRHDLEISARAAECRRCHIRLSQKCLTLATKTQILRNRGYAMDAEEEQLRQKLVNLERKALDPALHGRSEEIWARMVTVRNRGLALNAEMENLGHAARSAGVNADASTVLDESMMKKVKQVSFHVLDAGFRGSWR